MNSNAVKILEAALAYFEEGEHRWTKGELAKDANGEPLETYSDEAASCHCSMGAIFLMQDRIPSLRPYSDGYEAKRLLIAALPQQAATPPLKAPIPAWNDARETTYADVLAAFRKAIEIGKANLRREINGRKRP